QPSSKREVVSLDKMPIERILEWAEKEEVIDSPTADLFGVDFRAKRVAQYLIGAKQKAVAVVGPFGSGKTSLINLAATEAKMLQNPKLLFVYVSCWGFESAAAAQEAVLKQV